jgi:hypothetical protein
MINRLRRKNKSLFPDNRIIYVELTKANQNQPNKQKPYLKLIKVMIAGQE